MELMGAFVKPEKPKPSLAAVASADFQKQTEEYEKYNFGFRGFLIKFKNSINYLMYKELSTDDQLEGEDGYIFKRGSIRRNVTGELYNGKTKNDSTIFKINFLKERIEKRGGHLLVVIAPSKESIYPEKLPARYKNIVKEHSDFNDLAEGFHKNNIPFIDFTAYFRQVHKTSPYPLFTKTGYHWSVYGASLAQDSLLAYMQHFLPEQMPKYSRTGVEWSDTARWPDADFERPLNLLYSIQDHRYAYPKLEMIPTTSQDNRPKVIINGDSYFSMIKDLNKLQYILSDDSKYWYYFNESLIMSDNNNTAMKDIDILTELESADFVVLLGSPATLDEFPFGITDYYFENASKTGMVEKIKAYKRKNPQWVAHVINESGNKNTDSELLMSSEARRIFKMRKTIQLKAANHKFVCADASNQNLVLANHDGASTWETFTLLNLGGDQCVIYSYANKFLAVENGTEITARILSDTLQVFTLINIDGNRIALRAPNGKYLTIIGEQLFAKADSIGEQEKFELFTIEKNLHYTN
jgi:hypothetical protein